MSACPKLEQQVLKGAVSVIANREKLVMLNLLVLHIEHT